MLVTNDPYQTAGQLLDVTVLTPVFHGGRAIACFGSTIHHTDVGGYGIGAGARDVFEEGLWIPICRLMIGGERNPDVWKFILANVREPQHMAGDLHAQIASAEVGGRRLRRLCDDHGLADIEGLADEIITRSEEATRAAIRALPAGTYEAVSTLDLADGSEIRIAVALTVDPEAGEVLVDYTGSSEASPWGINVVRNYTHAYTTFTLRSVLNPEVPNNHGSLAPIKVEAPEGTIVHAVLAGAVHGPPRRRHVPAHAAAGRALAGGARPGDGRGRRRRVDHAGERHPRRRPSLHHGDVHLRRRHRGPGPQAGPVGGVVPDRGVGRPPRGGRGVGPDPLPAQGAAARAPAAGAPRRAGSARSSSSPSTRPGRGSSTPSRRGSATPRSACAAACRARPDDSS